MLFIQLPILALGIGYLSFLLSPERRGHRKTTQREFGGRR